MDPDPRQTERWDPDPDQSDKIDPDKFALCIWQAKIYGIWAYWSTFSKVLSLYLEARIRIRIRIKVKGRIRNRIHVEVTSRIWIRIEVMRIRNTDFNLAIVSGDVQ